MNPYTPTLPELVEDLRTELMRLAMAVDAMRRLQRARKPHEPMSITQARAASEDDVDKMVDRLLTPKPT